MCVYFFGLVLCFGFPALDYLVLFIFVAFIKVFLFPFGCIIWFILFFDYLVTFIVYLKTGTDINLLVSKNKSRSIYFNALVSTNDVLLKKKKYKFQYKTFCFFPFYSAFENQRYKISKINNNIPMTPSYQYCLLSKNIDHWKFLI